MNKPHGAEGVSLSTRPEANYKRPARSTATRLRAWERWLAAAGPWKGWCICPALVAPEADEVVPRAADQPVARGLAENLRQSLEPGGTLLILDLEPCLGVAVAALLNQWHLANAVLVIPRWPYRRSILRTDTLLHGLIAHAPHLAPDAALPNVSFVLDAQRSRSVRGRSPLDDRTDNRYRLLLGDLPDLPNLRARGVQRLIKLSSG